MKFYASSLETVGAKSFVLFTVKYGCGAKRAGSSNGCNLLVSGRGEVCQQLQPAVQLPVGLAQLPSPCFAL